MSAEHDVIKKLIEHIDTAVTKHSVSNRHVATVLEYLLNNLSEVDLEKLTRFFLRRDQEDTALEKIKFAKGAEFGEYLEAIIGGTGAKIDENGNAVFRKLNAEQMVIQETIINRLNAQEGDTGFSDNGTIESVTLEQDGTYTLALRKRWENDFTSFQEGDIIYGWVNNLFTAGTYYAVWMRVLSVNITLNTISVNLYPNSEVPGLANFPPEPLMVITRRGNAINVDRQSYWYISATSEKCIVWLEGVTKPILEENNYYMMLGRPKQLSIFDNLPLNYKQAAIYARAAIFQDIHRVTVAGVPVQELRNRDMWSAAIAASSEPYQCTQSLADTVWHLGCKWKCLVTGTRDVPRYAAQGWAMLEGNPEFTIGIDSSNGWSFDEGRVFDNVVFTTLTVSGKLYNQSVTDEIRDIDVTWTRDTGNVTEDNAWAIKMAEYGKALPLTLSDLGTDYMTRTVCTFKAVALLRDGQYENYDEITF